MAHNAAGSLVGSARPLARLPRPPGLSKHVVHGRCGLPALPWQKVSVGVGSDPDGEVSEPFRNNLHGHALEPGPGGVALQHERHPLSAETCRPDMTMAVHGMKS